MKIRLPINELYLRASAARNGLLLIGCFLVSFEVLADEPAKWLQRMEESIETLNFSGTLVYMRPGKAETFKVFHRVAGGEETERVVALDGDGAEIIRTADEVICIFPGQEKVVVDKRHDAKATNPLRANLPEYSPNIDTNYALETLANERFIDHAAVVIGISPRDEFRYGYRIWLDEKTAMPLKIQLLSQADEMPIEELFFTAIDLPDELAAELVESSLNTDTYTWVRNGAGQEANALPAASRKWQATDLPDGFMQTAAILEYTADAATPRTHLVYSDGLASVSVFIDLGAAASDQVEGATAVGTANTYSRSHDDLLITAMGVVPPQTVHRIASSMQLQPVVAAP